MTLRPIATLFVLVCSVHGVAWACICTSAPVEEALEYSDFAAYGVVTWVDGPKGRPCNVPKEGRGLGCDREVKSTCLHSGDRYPVSFAVIEGFVGAEDGETVLLEGDLSPSTCGHDLQVGQEWLLFARDGNTTGRCGGSREVFDADIDLADVRELTSD